jgi:putative transport protein
MREALVQLLSKNPLLLLFLVVAIGYPLGRVQVRGSRLGVAAILFVGLAAGAIDARLAMPEIVYMLGLALFVYALGLTSGRALVASLRREGPKGVLLAIAGTVGGAVLTLAIARALHLDRALAAGLFTGAMTSTPALAAAIETLKQVDPAAVSLPVVAYSIAYPFGVLGVVLAVRAVERVRRVDPAAEMRRVEEGGGSNEPLESATLRVTRDTGPFTLDELVRGLRFRVIFGRIRRDGQLRLATPTEHLLPGDLVTAVGTASELARVTERLGDRCDERIDLDRSEFDLRRIFVSNAEVAGRPLQDLDLPHRLGAVVTRVRRGDVDLLPHGRMRLEVGDRVRVLAPVRQLPLVAAFFGDSYRAASEVDILTFGLGLALGLLAGIVPIPLPGGSTFTLGFAGGPFLVAIVLGIVERTGPMVWTLPFSAGVALRQVGLILFLAGIGTRAGSGFGATIASGSGATLLLAGAAITFLTSAVVTFAGHGWLGIPMPLLVGLVGGMQTQTALLGWANERTGSEAPGVGFAAVYPIATVAKILLVHLLLAAGGPPG